MHSNYWSFEEIHTHVPELAHMCTHCLTYTDRLCSIHCTNLFVDFLPDHSFLGHNLETNEFAMLLKTMSIPEKNPINVYKEAIIFIMTNYKREKICIEKNENYMKLC